MYLDRRIFDSYVHEIWLPFIESKRKMVHFMSLATVKAETKLLPSTGHRHARGGEKPPGSPAGRCRVIFPIRDATFFEPIRQGLERAVPAWKRLAL